MDRVLPVGEVTDEVWNSVLAVNLNGPFYTSRKAVPLMVAQGGGVIVNTASGAAVRGGVAGAAYTASKHGVVGLTKSIASYYAKEGIRCNAVCPGGVATNIGVGGIPHAEGMAKLRKVLELTPRIAVAEEIATVALFLASDDASFVNGAVLIADGGWAAV